MRFFLPLLLILVGCQDYNSNTFDKDRYNSGCIATADPNYYEACIVTKKYCISCHEGYHNTWAQYTDNQAWIDSGLVIKNDALNSLFIQSIFNAGPTGTMPKYGTSLPNDEYEILVDWIDNMP